MCSIEDNAFITTLSICVASGHVFKCQNDGILI
jgi:hypothetical protein